jgi:hypothetical protein
VVLPPRPGPRRPPRRAVTAPVPASTMPEYRHPARPVGPGPREPAGLGCGGPVSPCCIVCARRYGRGRPARTGALVTRNGAITSQSRAGCPITAAGRPGAGARRWRAGLGHNSCVICIRRGFAMTGVMSGWRSSVGSDCRCRISAALRAVDQRADRSALRADCSAQRADRSAQRADYSSKRAEQPLI